MFLRTKAALLAIYGAGIKEEHDISADAGAEERKDLGTGDGVEGKEEDCFGVGRARGEVR